MGIDKCVIFFFVKTIADNQRCFSSYCVIVLSDRGSAPLQSTPATRPFIGMLMQTLQHNTIMQHNILMAHLLALYMCCCIVIMMAYPRCFCLFEGLEWSNNKRRRHLSKSVKDETMKRTWHVVVAHAIGFCLKTDLWASEMTRWERQVVFWLRYPGAFLALNRLLRVGYACRKRSQSLYNNTSATDLFLPFSSVSLWVTQTIKEW